MISLYKREKEDYTVQEKIKTLFNNISPPSNIEKQFMNYFSDGNYSKCEELLPSIVNPFSLKISLPEVRGLLEWKSATSSAKKLIRYLYQHP